VESDQAPFLLPRWQNRSRLRVPELAKDINVPLLAQKHALESISQQARDSGEASPAFRREVQAIYEPPLQQEGMTLEDVTNKSLV
jgi:LmbE family N-acetylglucosaminyl deacetylase